MTRPLVSVVIPAFNAEHYLGETLESVLAQTYEPVEVIVIDDGSTDDTADLARRYPVRLLQGPNGGRSVARNRGLDVARGDLIAFCDADDLWLNRRLEAQVGVLDGDPRLGVVSCQVEPFIQPGMPRPSWFGLGQMQTRRALLTSALLVRRELFETVGGFDPRYRIVQDTDWVARAISSGTRIGYVDEVLVRYRVHDANGSSDRELVHTEMLQVLRAAVARRRSAEGAPD